MKKKCLECVVLLLFIFALTHGIIQNTQPLKETKEVQTEYEEKTSQVTEKSQETEPEVQDLENQILRTASGKFFQKYPVDEAFMGWIETKYGSGVLQSLYTQLENGNQDPDLCVVSVYQKQYACSVAYVLQAATVYVIFV